MLGKGGLFFQVQSERHQCAINLFFQEAGYRVVDFNGKPAVPLSENLMAVPPHMYPCASQHILSPALSKAPKLQAVLASLNS